MVSTVVLDETEEQTAFRARAREWLAVNAPRRAERSLDDDDDHGATATGDDADVVGRAKDFQARLFDAGLAGITWPRDYGGQGLTTREQLIFAQEAQGYELPTAIYAIGHGMCGPTVLTHGTDAQKDRYIRPMLRGEEVWSQLFSEPGAGSDVASLQARAVRDGDEWILNGQKVWTSGAHYSEYGIVIARTDPDQPKHRGITMFILDMHAEGVTVKPLRQMTGGANFNEVFFDDVRIPADQLLGEVNEGWRCAITTLMNERVAIGAGGAGGRAGGSQFLIREARRRGLDSDPVVRQRLVDVFIRERVLGFVGKRITQAVLSGKVPGPEGSIAKLAGAELARLSSELGLAIAGPAGLAWAPDDQRGARFSTMVCSFPASAIAGGTNEVMRNIIGERVLGLPKEPQVDRDLPFRDLKVGTQSSP